MSVLTEVDPVSDMRAGLCSFCRKPVTKKTGFLEFFTQRGGSLRYPSHDYDGGEPIALFAHAACGPDDGYMVRFDRIGPGSGWLAHIREKTWCCGEYLRGLQLADDLVKRGV